MLSCWFIGRWRFLAVVSNPRRIQNVRFILYIFSKYEPADISYCLKHTNSTYIHSQIDAHTDRIVRIVLCFHFMDSCITFASPYLILPMLPSYTHIRLPQFTVSLYIWHYVDFEKLINMLYRNRNLFFFFSISHFSAQSPLSGEEHMHSAWLPSCTI